MMSHAIDPLLECLYSRAKALGYDRKGSIQASGKVVKWVQDGRDEIGFVFEDRDLIDMMVSMVEKIRKTQEQQQQKGLLRHMPFTGSFSVFDSGDMDKLLGNGGMKRRRKYPEYTYRGSMFLSNRMECFAATLTEVEVDHFYASTRLLEKYMFVDYDEDSGEPCRIWIRKMKASQFWEMMDILTFGEFLRQNAKPIKKTDAFGKTDWFQDVGWCSFGMFVANHIELRILEAYLKNVRQDLDYNSDVWLGACRYWEKMSTKGKGRALFLHARQDIKDVLQQRQQEEQMIQRLQLQDYWKLDNRLISVNTMEGNFSKCFMKAMLRSYRKSLLDALLVGELADEQSMTSSPKSNTSRKKAAGKKKKRKRKNNLSNGSVNTSRISSLCSENGKEEEEEEVCMNNTNNNSNNNDVVAMAVQNVDIDDRSTQVFQDDDDDDDMIMNFDDYHERINDICSTWSNPIDFGSLFSKKSVGVQATSSPIGFDSLEYHHHQDHEQQQQQQQGSSMKCCSCEEVVAEKMNMMEQSLRGVIAKLEAKIDKLQELVQKKQTTASTMTQTTTHGAAAIYHGVKKDIKLGVPLPNEWHGREFIDTAEYTEFNIDAQDHLTQMYRTNSARSLINPLAAATLSRASGMARLVDGPTRLCDEILRFTDVCYQKRQARLQSELVTLNKLCGVVKQLWPRAAVKRFGSCVTGLCLPDGDIDVVVCLPKVMQDDIADEPGPLEGRNAIKLSWQQNLAEALQLATWIDPDSVQTILTAPVPIIKLTTFSEVPLHLDISFQSDKHNGLSTNKLVKSLCKQFPALPPLVLVLKQFLLERGLGKGYTGGLSSYALILLVVCFLQTNTNTLAASSSSATATTSSNNRNFKRNRMRSNSHGLSTTTSLELGHLLVRLLRFYGDSRLFNPSATGVCITRGYFDRKTQHQQQKYLHHEQTRFDPVYIDDPLLPGNNVGRNCFRIAAIQRAFLDAGDKLRKAMIQGNQSALLNQMIKAIKF